MARRMKLRYDGVCVACGVALSAGTQAWWEPAAKSVTCDTCRSGGGDRSEAELVSPAMPFRAPAIDPPATDAGDAGFAPAPAPPSPAPPPPPPTQSGSVPPAAIDRGTPGASARAERKRRNDKIEAQRLERHPRIGGLLNAFAEEPTHAKVWGSGAVGEERVGGVLEAARSRGIEVLHDRRIPGSKANIDHIVVAPNGVWAVDAKRYVGKRLEVRDVGGWRRVDRRLFVGGSDRSKLVTDLHKQIGHIQQALADTPYAHAPVRGILCFTEVQLTLTQRPTEVDGIAVCWPKKLVGVLLDPKHPPVLDQTQVVPLATTLAARFKPN